MTDYMLHAGSVDIGAACEQSGRIAHQERMPSTGDRMYGYAQAVRDGAMLINLRGTVISDENGVTILEGRVGDKVVRQVIMTTVVGESEWDRNTLTHVYHPYGAEMAESYRTHRDLTDREFKAWKDKVVVMLNQAGLVHPDRSGLDLPFWDWWASGDSVDVAFDSVRNAYDYQDRA